MVDIPSHEAAPEIVDISSHEAAHEMVDMSSPEVSVNICFTYFSVLIDLGFLPIEGTALCQGNIAQFSCCK